MFSHPTPVVKDGKQNRQFKKELKDILKAQS